MLKRKIAIAFSVIVFISKLSAQTSYVYKNVQIRGGGYVTGLIFNSTRQNMLYARTDVGGAYKWNSSTGTWTPLTDHLGAADQNYTGVLSIATVFILLQGFTHHHGQAMLPFFVQATGAQHGQKQIFL
jgi:hypothetical protein